MVGSFQKITILILILVISTNSITASQPKEDKDISVQLELNPENEYIIAIFSNETNNNFAGSLISLSWNANWPILVSISWNYTDNIGHSIKFSETTSKGSLEYLLVEDAFLIFYIEVEPPFEGLNERSVTVNFVYNLNANNFQVPQTSSLSITDAEPIDNDTGSPLPGLLLILAIIMFIKRKQISQYIQSRNENSSIQKNQEPLQKNHSIFCGNCGTSNMSTMKFCNKCGLELK